MHGWSSNNEYMEQPPPGFLPEANVADGYTLTSLDADS